MPIKNLLLYALISPFCSWQYAQGKLVSIDLSEAIKYKMVTMDAINTNGGYMGKTTKLTIKNNSENTLQLKVNPGIILKPDNATLQPMVLAGEEMLVLAPSKEGDVRVFTFCGNSPKSSPDANSHFTFSRVGSDTLIKVIRFIKANAVYDYLGQDAVWVITNGHYIGGVYDPEREALSKQFQELLCKITGRPAADYYTVNEHVDRPAEPAYVPKPLKIIANFEILLDSPKTLTLGVFDSSGKMIQPVFENQSFPRAGHRFGVEFESADAPPGKYYIWLKEGDKVLHQKMVRVE